MACKIPEYDSLWGKLEYSKLKQYLQLSKHYVRSSLEIKFPKFNDGYKEEALRTCQSIPYEIIKEKDIHSRQVRHVLVMWFIALLALHEEGAPLQPPCRLIVLIAWTRMHAKNLPLTAHEAFPFCLILINVLINYYNPNSNYDLEEKCEEEELAKLITICHKFQCILSPINLLLNIASNSFTFQIGDCNSDDYKLHMFLISNRENSQKVLATVVERLVQDSITPYTTEIVNEDGSYPLHHAVTAVASHKVGSGLVEKMLAVGAYPYSVNKQNITPFKVGTLRNRERIGLLERKCIMNGLISDPPPLKTLVVKKILYYQGFFSSIGIFSYKNMVDTCLSSSLRNFVHRHSPAKP